MLKPIALPLTADDPSADRIAGLVLRIEQEAAPGLMVTTLAVRGMGGVQAWVIVHLSDGARERFSPGEARILAPALRDALGLRSQLEAWADSLEDAAETAERQASAILLGQDVGRGVSPMHPYWRGRA